MKVNCTKEILLGLFTPIQHVGFSTFLNNENEAHVLQTDAYQAFSKMRDQAKKEDIHLNIISSTRNFDRQKQIWENKWSGETKVSGYDKNEFLKLDDKAKAKAIMLYSAMPCTSRHHWGTDFDLNSLEPSFFLTTEGIKIYKWLVENATTFGFFQPYTPKNKSRPNGYEEEPWHWSYYPIAQNYLETYNKTIGYSAIQNFSGAYLAQELHVIEHYVNGIAFANFN